MTDALSEAIEADENSLSIGFLKMIIENRIKQIDKRKFLSTIHSPKLKITAHQFFSTLEPT